MKSRLTHPPAWFRFRSRLQEDTVASIQYEEENVDEMQRKAFADARAEARPMMTEVLRDLDSRPLSLITGYMQPWTRTSWERVRRQRRRKYATLNSLFLKFFQFFSNAFYS
jgi:hypothetical protein